MNTTAPTQSHEAEAGRVGMIPGWTTYEILPQMITQGLGSRGWPQPYQEQCVILACCWGLDSFALLS